jgi:hypothetical protein
MKNLHQMDNISSRYATDNFTKTIQSLYRDHPNSERIVRISIEPYHLRFNKDKLRADPTFQLIKYSDFPLEKFSIRR